MVCWLRSLRCRYCPVGFGWRGQAGFSEATINRRIDRAQPADPAVALLEGLNARSLATYDDFVLVEIHEADKDRLLARGRERAMHITVNEEFDAIFLNGIRIDTRNGIAPPDAIPADLPYQGDEQGTWIVQYIGPIKPEWLAALQAEGVVLVQYVASHGYIVAGRASAIARVAEFPFVQWTSQLHRYLKPAVSATDVHPRVTSATDESEPTVELWIELAQTEETPDTLAWLASISVGSVTSAPWSDAELRVEGFFRIADLALILAEPLVFGFAERPTFDLSDERAVLGLTTLVPTSPARTYKKWLSDMLSKIAWGTSFEVTEYRAQ